MFATRFCRAFVLVSLICCTVSAEDLLTPPSEAPSYQLSNPKTQNDRFGRSSIAIDYSRTKSSNIYGRLVARQNGQSVSIMGADLNKDSGTIELSSMFGRGTISDVEFYVIGNQSLAGKIGVTYLMSNTVRMGNPGQPVTARAWNEAEKAAYEKNKRANEIPANLPAGFVTVDKFTNLIPGVPIAAAYYGEWEPAEVLAQHKNGQYMVKLNANETIFGVEPTRIAINVGVQSQMTANPKQFTASLSLLPDGKTPLPLNAIALPEDLPVVIGLPLLLETGGRFAEVFALIDNGDSIKIRYPDRSNVWDKAHPRSEFAIDKDILKEASTPIAAEKFKSNIEDKPGNSAFPSLGGASTASSAASGRKKMANYPAGENPPKGAQVVPNDVYMPAKTPLAAYWGSKWCLVYVLEDNEDGTLAIHWDTYSDAWDCSLKREQLIIQNKELNKVRLSNTKSGKVSSDKADIDTTSLSNELRVWTDKTGNFKINAVFVSKSATQVTLKTEAGKPMTIAIDKLSETDQTLLGGIDPGVENPFAP